MNIVATRPTQCPVCLNLCLNSRRLGATIAQWIRLRLPLQSLVRIPSTPSTGIVNFCMGGEKNKKKQKEAGVGRNLINHSEL